MSGIVIEMFINIVNLYKITFSPNVTPDEGTKHNPAIESSTADAVEKEEEKILEQIPEIDEADKKKLFNAPDAVTSLGEALKLRYEKYKSTLGRVQLLIIHLHLYLFF